MRQYRRDRVYVFDSEGAPAISHIGRFSFITADSYMYAVQPIGDLERDPDRTALPSFRCCPRALVLSCVHSPRSSGRPEIASDDAENRRRDLGNC